MYVIILVACTKDTNVYKRVIVIVLSRTFTQQEWELEVVSMLPLADRGGRRPSTKRTLLETFSSNVNPSTRALNVHKARELLLIVQDDICLYGQRAHHPT